MQTLSRSATLRAPLYNTTTKYRGFNGTVSVMSLVNHPNAAARLLLAKASVVWGKAQHEALSRYHEHRADRLDAIWRLCAHRAVERALGRPWMFTDYQITAICREEVSDAKKRILRHCAYNAAKHHHLAMVHKLAAKKCKV